MRFSNFSAKIQILIFIHSIIQIYKLASIENIRIFTFFFSFYRFIFQVMRKPHSLNAAETSRDSFAKALYDRLFTWIVGHVNSAIDPALTDSNRHQDATVIGVLDIYGFEVFDNNSFEQFWYNFDFEY